MSIQGAELAELMKQSASDAVIFAQEEFDISLDGSIASLELLDELITQASARIASDDEEQTIFTVSTIAGAYAGEIFRKQHGGDWVYDTSDPTAPAVFLKLNDLTFTFMGIAYERLRKEPCVSVALYFEEAASRLPSATY